MKFDLYAYFVIKQRTAFALEYQNGAIMTKQKKNPVGGKSKIFKDIY